MNIRTTIAELNKSLGTPKPRQAFGTWPSYAWLVRGLVEKGHGVSDAVNHVLNNSGLPVTRQAFGSLRASFYQIKTREWPAEFSKKQAAEVEGFE